MDRNSITGILLIFIFVMFWSYLYVPTEQPKKENFKADTLKQKQQIIEQKKVEEIQQLPDSQRKVLSESLLGKFAPLAEGSESVVKVKTEKLEIECSTLGGDIRKVILNDYKTFDQLPLPVYNADQANRTGIQFLHGTRLIDTRKLFFKPSVTQLDVKGSDKKQLSMKAEIEPGKHIEFLYIFTPKTFDISFSINMVGLQDEIRNGYYELKWAQNLAKIEKSKEKMLPESSVYFNYGDEVEYLPMSESLESKKEQGNIKWVGFKSQFFTSAIFAKEHFELMDISSEPNPLPNHVRNYKASLQVPYKHAPKESFEMTYFFGPNDLNLLSTYGYDFDRLLSIGWAPIRAIVRWVIAPIFSLLEGMTSNYGLIILLLALIIKLILTPLTYRSHLSTAKMKIVNGLPEMKELDEKYKDDATKLQTAKMALYKKVGVSPMAGCLPMLVQFPFLISMFLFFPAAIQLRQQGFLWADDLSTYDSILDFGFNIPFFGDHLSLFTLLMTISTLIYTWQQQKAQGNNGPKELKYMGYIMPIIFLGILNSYAAGLSYYYFVMNVMTIVQTIMMNRMVNENELHEKIQQAKNSTAPVKKSKMEQFLEAQQQKQEELRKQQKNKKK